MQIQGEHEELVALEDLKTASGIPTWTNHTMGIVLGIPTSKSMNEGGTVRHG
jgi:hypothetical protein